MTGKKILVIGGGFGGVATARTCRRLLGQEHEVTLVNRNRKTFLCGSLPLLIVGEREASGISRSLGSLANRGIRFIESEVREINLHSKTVSTSVCELKYDYLVVALGAEYDTNAVPHSEDAYSFYDLKNAKRLRRKLRYFREGTIVIGISSTPYKCPPAPFETAMLLDWYFTQQNLRKQISIHIFSPEPSAMPITGPQAGERILKTLRRKGIETHFNIGAAGVDREGKQMVLSNGNLMNGDIIITIPKHQASPVVKKAGLTGKSGWIDVSPETLETNHEGVYAVGDVNMVPMSNGRAIPKAGVFASSEGEIVGKNIAASIEGSKPESFDGVGQCFIAYNATQAGKVTGEFLAKDKPIVALKSATARGFKSKEKWEKNWKRFKV